MIGGGAGSVEDLHAQGWLIDPMPAGIARAFRLTARNSTRMEGYCRSSVLAGYAHLHFRSASGFAKRFVEACARVERSFV